MMNLTTKKAAEVEFAHVAQQLTTDELMELKRRLDDGWIDGTVYIADGCGCFYGTIYMARAQEVNPDDWDAVETFRNELIADADIPVSDVCGITALEESVYKITLGDSPETSEAADWLYQLICSEIARREAEGAASTAQAQS